MPAPAPTVAAPVVQQQQQQQQQPEIKPIERAARTINDTLTQEARYPDLDSYITREFACSYALSGLEADRSDRGNIIRL